MELEQRPLRHVEDQLRSHGLRAVVSCLTAGAGGGLRNRLKLVVGEPTRARVDEAVHHFLDECPKASLAVRSHLCRDVELGTRNISRVVAVDGQPQVIGDEGVGDRRVLWPCAVGADDRRPGPLQG